MNLNNYYTESISIEYYANSPLKVGDIVAVKSTGKEPVVDRIHKTKRKVPIGISKVNCIPIDKLHFSHLRSRSIVPLGSKIEIMKKGEIVAKFNKKLRIPTGQPIYVNLEKSTLTWKKLGPLVGTTTSDQDQDGYIKVKFNFEGI